MHGQDGTLDFAAHIDIGDSYASALELVNGLIADLLGLLRLLGRNTKSASKRGYQVKARNVERMWSRHNTAGKEDGPIIHRGGRWAPGL